jgi:exodeoxyribonuclease VII large subunit
VRDDCLEALTVLAGRLMRRVEARLDREAQRLDHAALRLARPAQALMQRRRQLDLLAQRLQGAPARRLGLAVQQQAHLAGRLQRAAGVQLDRCGQRLEGLHRRLEALNPRRVLSRGYAYLTATDGQALVSVAGVVPGQPVQAVLADGQLSAQVLAVRPHVPEDGS